MKTRPPSTRLFAIASALFLTALSSISALAANWPQYRGPNASGLDTSVALPTQWNATTGENIRWQTPIPGLAHSSPIVWNDLVFVTSGGRDVLDGYVIDAVDAADAPRLRRAQHRPQWSDA